MVDPLNTKAHHPVTGSVWFLRISWACTLLVACYLLSLPIREFLIHFSIADGLAYARIAFNFAQGHGSTFDGITTTNGYHPLWMWLHVPLFLGADTAMSRMALARLLWVATTLGAVAVWSVYVQRITRSRLAASILVMVMGCFGWTIYVLYAGVETPLFLLLMGLSLLLTDQLIEKPMPSRRACASLGIVMVACFLSRLDGIFALFPLGLIILFHLRRSGVRCIAAWLSPVVLIPVPYFAWNIMTFGHLMPISGRVKTMEHLDLARTVNNLTHWAEKKSQLLPSTWLPILGVAGAIAFVVVMWGVWQLIRNERRVLRVLWVLPAGAVGQYVYYLFRIREINIPWHLFMQFQSLYVGIAIAAYMIIRKHRGEQVAGGRSVREIATYVLVIIMVSSGTAVYVKAKSKHRPGVAISFDVADWIVANLPENTTLAMYDSFNIAIIADKMHVVDMNGLVGNATLANLARKKDQPAIIEQFECNYVVTWINDECKPSNTDAYLYLSESAPDKRSLRLAVVHDEPYKTARKNNTKGFPCP